MSFRFTTTLFLAGVMTSFASIPASAQGTVTVAAAAHRQVISASPLLWIFKWYNADYEHTITPATTWGVSGSYVSFGDEDDYGRTSVVLRYYPQGTAFEGFSLGAQAGVFRRATRVCAFVIAAPSPPPAPARVPPPVVCTPEEQHDVRPGAGVDLGYGWLLGAKQNLTVTLGFGVSRVFGGSIAGLSSVVPNARLVNVGIAF